MPARKHLLSLQKRHWFLLSLSTTHCLLNLQNMQSYQSKKIVTYHSTIKYATLKQKANYHYFWQIILRVHEYKNTFVMIYMTIAWTISYISHMHTHIMHFMLAQCIFANCTCRYRRGSCVSSVWRSLCSHHSWRLHSVSLWLYLHRLHSY